MVESCDVQKKKKIKTTTESGKCFLSKNKEYLKQTFLKNMP